MPLPGLQTRVQTHDADSSRFLSGPWMARHFQGLQPIEIGPLRESRLSENELIECRHGI